MQGDHEAGLIHPAMIERERSTYVQPVPAPIIPVGRRQPLIHREVQITPLDDSFDLVIGRDGEPPQTYASFDIDLTGHTSLTERQQGHP